MDRADRKFAVRKTRVLALGVLICFCLLGLRLFHLQILSNELFAGQAQRNRMRFMEVEAKRGEILDVNGVVLATSQPVYVVSLEHLRDDDERVRTIRKLGEVLQPFGISTGEIQEKVDSNLRRFEATPIVSLPWGLEAAELISVLAERRAELPGVVISTEPMRIYPEGELAGHVIGHIGAITQEELEAYDPQHYRANDKVGKSGLEKALELLPESATSYVGLKGTRGLQQIEVDSTGRPVQEMDFSLEPIPGDSLRLTLDANLQKSLDEAIDTVIADVSGDNPKAGSGSAVVIDVNTGGILAISSRPGFDPSDFIGGLSQEQADYYYNNPMRPEINKAVASAYPPGSTFKMITGMAYLEHTGASPNATVRCTGAYWKPPYIRCTGTHGSIGFYRAMAVSCNTFFQHAGDVSSIDNISLVSAEFGLGVDPGLRDLPVVTEGFLPSRDNKQVLQESYLNQRLARYQRQFEARVEELREEGLVGNALQEAIDEAEKRRNSNNDWARRTYAFEQNWQAYDTYNSSIGQGYNNFSMLQMANYVATIANGGIRYRPHLVSEIISESGATVRKFEPEVLQTTSVSPVVMQNIQRSMRGVAQPGGTAYRLFEDFPIPVAAKTGTAQTGRSGDDPTKDYHGVFVAYAPYDNPQIAIAVVVEYGGQGGRSAGVVARSFFGRYFGLDEEFILIDPGYYLESPLNGTTPDNESGE